MQIFTSNVSTLIILGIIVCVIILIMRIGRVPKTDPVIRHKRIHVSKRGASRGHTQINDTGSYPLYSDPGTVISSDYEMQQLDERNHVIKTFPLCNLENGVIVGHYKGAAHTSPEDNDIELVDNVRHSVSNMHARIAEDSQGLFMQLVNKKNYITDKSRTHYSELAITPGEIYYIGKVPVRFVKAFDDAATIDYTKHNNIDDEDTKVYGKWKKI